jgi:hypothetical protein
MPRQRFWRGIVFRVVRHSDVAACSCFIWMRVLKVKVLKETLLTLALTVGVTSLAGCGSAGDQPELGQVTGTITLDGQPLKGIAVVFYPDNGRPARGSTNAEGKYELRYIRDTKGTKIGHNRVEVAPNEEGEDDFPDAQGEEATVKPKAKGGKPQIPARYNSKSELEADVKPGENVFDFKLESAAPAK